MGLLEKLKSVFGSTDHEQTSSSGEPGVTVEHDPSVESERAAESTDGATEASAQTGVETTAETDVSDETDEAADPTEPDTEIDGAPVDEIRGIGPTYSERLEAAGVETVAELATADAERVADAVKTSTSRAENWIERARNR
jgi:predicted flap endonuclease-1-like 5' DNA nuclease